MHGFLSKSHCSSDVHPPMNVPRHVWYTVHLSLTSAHCVYLEKHKETAMHSPTSLSFHRHRRTACQVVPTDNYCSTHCLRSSETLRRNLTLLSVRKITYLRIVPWAWRSCHRHKAHSAAPPLTNIKQNKTNEDKIRQNKSQHTVATVG